MLNKTLRPSPQRWTFASISPSLPDSMVTGPETAAPAAADPEPGDPGVGPSRLISGDRQVAAVLFAVMTILALVAATAYLAGRIASPVSAATPSSASDGSRLSREEVIVVDPPANLPPAVIRTPAAATVATTAPKIATPPPVTAPVTPNAKAPAPPVGHLYLQVGAMTRGMAEVTQEFLGRKGFAARVAPGPDETTYRVLVGPITSAEQMTKLRTDLQEAGFPSFSRRY